MPFDGLGLFGLCLEDVLRRLGQELYPARGIGHVLACEVPCLGLSRISVSFAPSEFEAPEADTARREVRKLPREDRWRCLEGVARPAEG